MIAGLDHDVAARWWPPLPQPKVPQDLLADGLVLDHREQPHLAATAIAHQNVLPPHAPEQLGPRETASAGWVVRADEVGVGLVLGVVLVLRVQIYSQTAGAPRIVESGDAVGGVLLGLLLLIYKLRRSEPCGEGQEGRTL